MSTPSCRPALPVPRLAGLPRERFESEFLAQGRPVLLEGAASGWPAFSAWTTEGLKHRLEGLKVEVASSEHDVFAYEDAAAAYQVEEMPFAEAADLITRARPSTRRYYLMQQSIPRAFPQLAPDLPTPEYVGRARTQSHLWYGTEGNVTPLHYDMANNLFAQLRGRKRILLFHPDQSELLYPWPATSPHHNLSRLDPEAADLGVHPRFAEAQPWTCEVDPGDLLFMPAYWWHQVRSLEVGLSVSVWWAPRPEQFLAPMARRMTPVLYQRDRLLTFKAMVSEPGEHSGFLGMARFMAARGQAALAALFAGAALEEALRMLYLRNVKPQDTAALREGTRMAEALGGCAVLGAAEVEAVREWMALVARALAGEEPAVEAGPQAMVDGVAALLEAHGPRPLRH